MDTREFNRLMKYAHMNDDPRGLLNCLYDENLPHPYFDPNKVSFRDIYNYDTHTWIDRASFPKDKTIVFRDIEYQTINDLNDHVLEHDKLILSGYPRYDVSIKCDWAFHNWHLFQTVKANKNIHIIQPAQRPYFADILLGSPRDYRLEFYTLLQKNDMIDDNIINLFGVYKTPFIDQGTTEIDIFFRNSLDSMPQFNGHFASQYISKHIIENSWVSVIAETLTQNEYFHPSEKVAKPLIAKRPFIALAQKNYLKDLRSMGFKTFDPIIDESYDVIDNQEQRIQSAFESLKKLQKLDQNYVRDKLNDVFEHNYNLVHNNEKFSLSARSILSSLITPV